MPMEHSLLFWSKVDQIESEIEQVYAGSRKKKLDRDVRFVLMRKKVQSSKILPLIDSPWGHLLLHIIKTLVKIIILLLFYSVLYSLIKLERMFFLSLSGTSFCITVPLKLTVLKVVVENQSELNFIFLVCTEAG